jgi:hypothetical protein
MNFKNFQIPSVYTTWNGLSLKTISSYCPFKGTGSQDGLKLTGAFENLRTCRFTSSSQIYPL